MGAPPPGGTNGYGGAPRWPDVPKGLNTGSAALPGFTPAQVRRTASVTPQAVVPPMRDRIVTPDTAQVGVKTPGRSTIARGVRHMTSDRDHTDHEASASGGPPPLLTTLRRLFGPEGPSPVLCRMRYAVDDPYAVALDLFGDLDIDVCVTWVVARDLLAGEPGGPAARATSASGPPTGAPASPPVSASASSGPEGTSPSRRTLRTSGTGSTPRTRWFAPAPNTG